MTSGRRRDTSADGATDATLPPGPASDLGASQAGHHDTAQFEIGEFGEPSPVSQPSPVSEPGQLGQDPGSQYPGYQPQPFGRGSRTNPLAIAALVCGFGQFSLGLLIVGNILLAIPALVLGMVGLRQTTTRNERGRGMAIAGIVLGALGILYFALVLILIVASLSGRFARS
jgi:hypothetical protein